MDSLVFNTLSTDVLMLVLEVLVLKLLSIDRLSSAAVPIRKVSALTHEPFDDAVESCAFIVQRFLGVLA